LTFNRLLFNFVIWTNTTGMSHLKDVTETDISAHNVRTVYKNYFFVCTFIVPRSFDFSSNLLCAKRG